MFNLNLIKGIRSSRLRSGLMGLAAISITLGSTLVFQGCGGRSANTEQAPLPGYPSPGPGTTYGGGPGDGPPSTYGPGPGPGPGDGVVPTETFDFQVTGTGGTAPEYITPQIETDSLLKVKITAGPASIISIPGQYSGYSANYSCVGYAIEVLGQKVNTQVLSVSNGSYLCPYSPNSQTIDFSSRLSPGPQRVRVKVKELRNDFYCLACLDPIIGPYFFNSYYYGCNAYCPLRPAYRNHTATGTLEVQINGSVL